MIQRRICKTKKIHRHLVGLLSLTTLFYSSQIQVSIAEEEQVDLRTIVVSGEAAQNTGDTSSNPASTALGIVPKSSASATKSDTPIVRIPQTISVVTSKEMKQRAVQNSSEAFRYLAGVASEPYGADPRADWIRVRGYHAPEYLDGLRMARGIYAWPRVDPFMLESIEVLRGPSGSLYGQTPPGGLLNQVSKLPRDKAHGEIGLQVGSPERVQLSADIGGPIGKDNLLSYRLIGVFRKADTQVDHVNDDRMALSGAVKARLTDHTDLTVLGNIINDESKSLQFLPALGTVYNNPDGQIDRSFFTGEPDFDDFKLRQHAAGYLFNHEFENGLKLSQKARFTSVDYDLKTARGVGLATGSTTILSRAAAYINELTEASNIDTNFKKDFKTATITHRINAGFDYLQQKSDISAGIGSASDLDIFNPVYGGTTTPAFWYFYNHKNELKQFGIYAQNQMSWRNWELTLSARNDWFEATSLAKATGTKVKNDGDQMTWRAGLLYAFDNGISPYVNYSTSFEPISGTDITTGQSFKPIESEQIEAGIKYAPLGMNALLTATIFELKEKNTLASIGSVKYQIGESRVRGLELEGRAEFENGIGLMASYAYMDSEITDGASSQIGNRLPFVPEHQATAQVSYDFARRLEGLTITGGVRYFGASFGDAANAIKTDEYTLFDAGMSYDFDKLRPELEGLSLSVSATNVLDKTYISNCQGDYGGTCYYGAGRTVRASLGYKW